MKGIFIKVAIVICFVLAGVILVLARSCDAKSGEASYGVGEAGYGTDGEFKGSLKSNGKSGNDSDDETIGSDRDHGEIKIHVCGAVTSPGVYSFKEGSRVSDAITAAGGFLPDADTGYLNLADYLKDGQQIKVPTVSEAAEESRKIAEKADGIVNINKATKEELMTLSGIGESRAETIIKYREENGTFEKIEDIMNVPGIKESAFAKIKDKIKV